MNGKTKIIAMAMLLMLMVSPVFAAITVTWNTPAANARYNNYPANAKNIDLNFLVTDNNASVKDHNLSVVVRDKDFAVIETIVSDYNVHSGSTYLSGTVIDLNCWLVNNMTLLSRYTCKVIWDMPENTSLADGIYYLDANISSVVKSGDTMGQDKNALRTIYIDNGFVYAQQTREMLLPMGIVLIAALLVSAILAVTMLGADVGKTLMVIVVGAIVIVILLMVFGQFVSMI